MLLHYYGPKHPIIVSGKKDTVYYEVPDFKFTNQYGNTTTPMKGRIWVCCFKHMKDQTMSPSMAILMNRVEERTDRDSALRIVTFALDSESTKSLIDYAHLVHAGHRQLFVSGRPQELQDFAASAFYQPVDSSSEKGFVYFFLVDKEGHIRGIYNGLHIKEIDDLVDHIGMLEAAYSVLQNKEEGKKDRDNDGI